MRYQMFLINFCRMLIDILLARQEYQHHLQLLICLFSNGVIPSLINCYFCIIYNIKRSFSMVKLLEDIFHLESLRFHLLIQIVVSF